MVNYTKKLVRGSISVFGISIIAAIVAYFVRILFARNLTVEQYGLFYSIFSFLTIVCILADLGLNAALANFISKFNAKKQFGAIKSAIFTAAFIQLLSYTAVSAIIFLLSDFLAIKYFKVGDASLIIKLIMISFFFNSFVYVLWFSLQGLQAMSYYASVDLVRMVLVFTVSFFLFESGYGIEGAAIAYITTALLLIIIYYFVLTKKVFRKFKDYRPAISKYLTKDLFKFALPVTAGAAGIVILNLTDTVMLTYLSGLKSVALYNVALPTARLLLYFGIAIGSVLFPVTAELWANGKKDLIKSGVELIYKYSFMIVLPLSLLLFSFPDIIISLLFGKQYLTASNALRILSISAIIMTFTQINANVIIGMGRPSVNSKFIYIGAFLNVAGNAIAIPLYGISGAAVATLVSFLAILILNFMYIKKEIGIVIGLRPFIINLFCGVALLMIIWVLKSAIQINQWAEAAIISTLAVVVYLAMLCFFKVLDVQEIKRMLKRARE